jgi:antitoxin YefM
MTKTLPITEARNKLTTLVDRADRLLEKFIITVNGKPGAVLMSHDEYESWVETMDILSEPGALEEIKKAEKEVEEGKYHDWEDVKKELKLDV